MKTKLFIITLFILFILSMGMYGQKPFTDSWSIEEQKVNRYYFIDIRDTVIVNGKTYIYTPDIWRIYVDTRKDTVFADGKRYIHTPEKKENEIKYKCPNGCEGDIFFKIYSVPMSVGEKWIKLSPSGKTIDYGYPYICYYCKGNFSEKQLLATAKAYRDSMESVKSDTIKDVLTDAHIYKSPLQRRIDSLEKRIEELIVVFDSLEKRVEELEKLLEGKLLLEQPPHSPYLQWFEVILDKINR